MSEQTSSTSIAATSTGQALTDASYLDAHYVAFQPEYEAMLHWVDIQPGWHVLDAGCGGGSHLPLLAVLVGERGKVSAIDLAPENIQAVEKLVNSRKLHGMVEARVGGITTLPYADNTFDAVWCGNVTQYLSNTELRIMLAEFRRVVRPGGTVAVKDVDITSWQIQPADPALVWRLLDSARRNNVPQVIGVLRAIELPKWFREAGFTNIRRKTTLIERFTPLRPAERTFIGSVIPFWATMAETVNVSPEDLQTWRALADVKNTLNHPDFYWKTTQIVVGGQVS